MKIIGEKINGTRKRVGQAIKDRDHEYIQELAVKQTAAGAAFLDINAGTNPEREADDMTWLVQHVQKVSDTPLCLDSPNPEAILAGLAVVKQTPMINSISGEQSRLGGILPLVARHNCPVIVLALDDSGIPKTGADRVAIVENIITETRSSGIPDSNLYIDPLAMTLSTDTDGAKITLDTMQIIRDRYPETHFTIGLSNISFGLPARKFVNRTFLSLAMAAGLDSAILDPLNRDMIQTIYVTELVLGEDRFAQNYSRAYRRGVFDD
jgi:5-methyltetrahydrofolate--homocysteine methyltransferase